MAQSLQPNVPPYDPTICELEEFWFHVLAVNDTNDIRGIVLDPERMEKMKKLKFQMKVHYNHEETDEEFIREKKYYAVFDEEWHRVKCLNCDYMQGTATVLFIDRGDEDILLFTDLLPLHPKFCSLPAQCVRLLIDGLAPFQDCIAMQSMIDDLLLDKDVFVKILTCKKSKNEALHLIAELILYEIDESKAIAVKNLLQDEILESIANPLKNIDNNELFQEVHISHLSSSGIFVQFKSEGMVYLTRLIDVISREFLDTECYKHQTVTNVDQTKIYLFKNRDSKWYRVRVTKMSFRKVRVRLIDVGNELVIDHVQLVPLEGSSNFLSRYPEQAIKVKLHKISSRFFDERAMVQFRQLVSNYEVLHMRTMPTCDDVPVVQFYQRDSRNNLILINNALEIPIILSQCPPESRKKFPLTSPNIPKKDSCFDVRVVLVAHPENLIVQPLSSAFQLQSLMIDLLNVCKSFSGPHLTPDCIKIGEMYAAINVEDDTWYRGFIYKKLNDTTFAVYACDYGDCFIASLEDLQPLRRKFYDLPFQAIRASLVGINLELLEKWTVSDSIKLNKLMTLKDFVAVVRDQEIDTRVFGQINVNLELIDTSSDDDIYITDLINNRIGPWE